jgi:hypothetical protein
MRIWLQKRDFFVKTDFYLPATFPELKTELYPIQRTIASYQYTFSLLYDTICHNNNSTLLCRRRNNFFFQANSNLLKDPNLSCPGQILQLLKKFLYQKHVQNQASIRQNFNKSLTKIGTQPSRKLLYCSRENENKSFFES